MNFVIVFVITILVLFFLNFLTRRRFGVIALALAAGTILSTLWEGNVTPLVSNAGISESLAPLPDVVAGAIILLPAVILLVMGGPTYRGKLARFLGSAAFAILATTFLLEPLGAALLSGNANLTVYHFLDSQRTLIVSLGLILAVLDLVATKTPKQHHKRKDHHERD